MSVVCFKHLLAIVKDAQKIKSPPPLLFYRLPSQEMQAEKLRRRKGKKKNNCLHITKEGGGEGKQLRSLHLVTLLWLLLSLIPLFLTGTKFWPCCFEHTCSFLQQGHVFQVCYRSMLDRIWEWHQLALLSGRRFSREMFFTVMRLRSLGFYIIVYNSRATNVGQLNQHIRPSLLLPHSVVRFVTLASEQVSVVVEVAIGQKWETFFSKCCSLRSLGRNCVSHGNNVRNTHKWIHILCSQRFDPLITPKRLTRLNENIELICCCCQTHASVMTNRIHEANNCDWGKKPTII